MGMVPAGPVEMVHPSGNRQRGEKSLAVYAGNSSGQSVRQTPAYDRRADTRHRGRGYDIHDGTRWDWERGDLISIPAMAEHQHFNADSSSCTLVLSSMPSVGVGLGVGGIEQLEDAPEFVDSARMEGVRGDHG